jgi:hypothetical protein
MIVDTMTGDNSDTTLTLSVAPVSENNVQVYFDGVYQSKANYSISGTTLTFSTAPATGVSVEAITHTQTTINEPAANTVTPTKIAAGDFYFDTDTLYIDSTNNRVGIGTSSPNATLNVATSSSKVAEFERTGVSVFDLTIGDVGDGASQLWFNAQTNDTGFNFRPKSSGGTTTNALLIDPDGNVGIGTTSPAAILEVSGGSADYDPSASGTGLFHIKGGATSLYSGYIGISDAGMSLGHNGGGSRYLRFDTNETERMRINSSGEVSIAGAAVSPFMLSIGGTADDSIRPINLTVASTAARTQIAFNNTAGTVGTISTSSTSTAYNTSSDYRLKENVVTDWDATTRLKQLRPSRFNFISDADTTVDGFLAHEVSDIVPEAITGEKDATETLSNVVLDTYNNVIATNIEEDDWTAGKTGDNAIYPSDSIWEESHTRPVYQAIDQSKLVPLLVKTIQELEARITTLENA